MGVASVQLAFAMGHTVIALSRSAEKSRQLEKLGATATFTPEDTQWRQSLKAKLASRRVDLAIDNIGGKLLPEVIDTLGEGGRVSLVGRLAGPVPNFNTATMFLNACAWGESRSALIPMPRAARHGKRGDATTCEHWRTSACGCHFSHSKNY